VQLIVAMAFCAASVEPFCVLTVNELQLLQVIEALITQFAEIPGEAQVPVHFNFEYVLAAVKG
jgi:DNA replication initiation complex subunit (GINS family)